MPTTTTVVTGRSAQAREAAIAAAAGDPHAVAVILEGIPDGKGDSPLAAFTAVTRIAPGCLCCTGNLVLRVTLHRVLRQRPQRLFIALADAGHAHTLHTLLGDSPYHGVLALTAPINA